MLKNELKNSTNTNLTIPDMYDGEQDLAEASLFQGGFINYGYWQGIDLARPVISKEDRIKASENLYKQMFRRLELKSCHKILEVGCARGYGTMLLYQQQYSSKITGMDLLQAQIVKARDVHRGILMRDFDLSFIDGRAEQMPFNDEAFDRIFSLEALQHFESIDDFFSESKRTLQAGGRLVFATFFATNKQALSEICRILPVKERKVDNFYPIKSVCNKLTKLGFTVECESIGEHIWYGFDKWLRQTGHSDEWGAWGLKWLVTYKKGLVDYYIVSATKNS